MLIHSGSVKDILQAGSNTDELIFQFTDRYSVFDWGQMPDLIAGKGLALAKMGKLFFDELSAKGVKTHFLGLGATPTEFRVKKIDVPRGKPETYRARPEWTLVPLEVIYRFGVPKGSSLLKRSSQYFEGQEFVEPLIDFTTKLERMDRPLTHAEAKDLSIMNEAEWTALLGLTTKIGKQLRERFQGLGFKLWDGKLEFAFGQKRGEVREIILVDTVGLDEMRLTLDGKPLSKEILRQFYLESDWYRGLARAKETDSVKFKELCVQQGLTPKPLSPAVIHAVGDLYSGVAEALDGQATTAFSKIRKALNVVEQQAQEGKA